MRTPRLTDLGIEQAHRWIADGCCETGHAQWEDAARHAGANLTFDIISLYEQAATREGTYAHSLANSTEEKR